MQCTLLVTQRKQRGDRREIEAAPTLRDQVCKRMHWFCLKTLWRSWQCLCAICTAFKQTKATIQLHLSLQWWPVQFYGSTREAQKLLALSRGDIVHRDITPHYIDVIMTTMASQITSLMVVYSYVYSDSDQRIHQSSASLAFVWGIHRDQWIPLTKGQLRGIFFHLMTSSRS